MCFWIIFRRDCPVCCQSVLCSDLSKMPFESNEFSSECSVANEVAVGLLWTLHTDCWWFHDENARIEEDPRNAKPLDTCVHGVVKRKKFSVICSQVFNRRWVNGKRLHAQEKRNWIRFPTTTSIKKQSRESMMHESSNECDDIVIFCRLLKNANDDDDYKTNLKNLAYSGFFQYCR